MLIVIDAGQILTYAANVCVIVGSLYGVWRLLKREWRKPSPPDD